MRELDRLQQVVTIHDKDRLQQVVTIHDNQSPIDLDSESEESAIQISSSSDQEQPVPPPSTNGIYQKLSSPAAGNNGLLNSSDEEQLPALLDISHEEEQLLTGPPDLPQPALHSAEHKLSPVSNRQNNLLTVSSVEQLQVGQAVHVTTSPSLLSPWQPGTVSSVHPGKCEVLLPFLPLPVP